VARDRGWFANQWVAPYVLLICGDAHRDRIGPADLLNHGDVAVGIARRQDEARPARLQNPGGLVQIIIQIATQNMQGFLRSRRLIYAPC
jgi:hypothetical protein